jgi:hypothetical protein
VVAGLGLAGRRARAHEGDLPRAPAMPRRRSRTIARRWVRRSPIPPCSRRPRPQ